MKPNLQINVSVTLSTKFENVSYKHMCSGINELESELNKSQTLNNDLKSVNERK